MEHIDRVAARVSTCFVLGLFGGASYATWRGSPLRVTTFKVAGSFAMVGTALFGAERLFYLALKSYMISDGDNDDNSRKLTTERNMLLTSHTMAGIVGGSFNGLLYQRRATPAMFYFTPFMIGVALLDLEYETRRQRRLNELMESFDEEASRTDS